jgi:uncharacterized protein (DUF1697 family)
MVRYAAFMRAINVGKRRVKMDALRVHVETLGFTDARTLIASGNVAFTDPDDLPLDAVSARFDEGLSEALGFRVDSALRTRDELDEICARQLFADDPWTDDDVVHVSFLLGTAPSDARDRLAALSNPADRFWLGARELHWRRRGRLTDSTVDPRDLARAIGVDTTARRLDTVDRMRALLES